MQAIAWIATNDARVVLLASLDPTDWNEGNKALISVGENNWYSSGDVGLQFININLRCSVVDAAEKASRHLLRALQHGRVTATAERYVRPAGIRERRAAMTTLDWAGLSLGSAPDDQRKIALYKVGEISTFVNGKALVDDWQSIRIEASGILATWPESRTSSVAGVSGCRLTSDEATAKAASPFVAPAGARRYVENKPPITPLMLAFEVLAWISYRRAIPFEQFSCLWTGDPGLERPGRELAMLDALKARAGNDTGYCYRVSRSTRTELDEIPSRHKVLTRDGPRILRLVRAQQRRQHGGLLTFEEIATTYHNQVMTDWTVSHHLKCAMLDLRQSLAAELLAAYGVPYGSLGEPNASFPAERIPHTIFMRREVIFAEWNMLGIDDIFPQSDLLKRSLPSFEQIQCKTSEVMRVWPPSDSSRLLASGLPSARDWPAIGTESLSNVWPRNGHSESIINANSEMPSRGKDENISARTGAPGRPSSAHLVDREFDRRGQAGEVENTLACEAQVLSAWLKANHPGLPNMTPRTIENRIRDAYQRRAAPRK